MAHSLTDHLHLHQAVARCLVSTQKVLLKMGNNLATGQGFHLAPSIPDNLLLPPPPASVHSRLQAQSFLARVLIFFFQNWSLASASFPGRFDTHPVPQPPIDSKNPKCKSSFPERKKTNHSTFGQLNIRNSPMCWVLDLQKC